jgi:hypothetical protein
VNGTVPDIQVLRPFNEGLERMKQMLFRPFDLTKWFIIGFTAWLANLGGGGGFNYRTNIREPFPRHNPAWQQFSQTIHQTSAALIILAVICLVVLIVGLIVLFAWLRARGAFMFTDCIVRDRAAVVEPWREFRKLGNSFFLLSLLVALCFVVLAVLAAVPFLLLMVRGGVRHHFGFVPAASLMLWVCVMFIMGLAWRLIANLMVPIMYRRRCLAAAAFSEAVGLISRYPGEITIYCLFWIVLGIAALVVGCVTACVTCCIAALPYIGTVILLPVYLCLRSFTLFYVRQFGPDYDVWAGITLTPPPVPITPREPPPIAPPPEPPPSPPS